MENFAEAVNQLPLDVTQVTVIGSQRTRSSAILKYFGNVEGKRTVEGLTDQLSEAAHRLKLTNCFKGINIQLDSSPVDAKASPDIPVPTAIKVFVAEHGIASPLKLSLFTQSGEYTAAAEGGLRNVFGGLESVNVTGSVGNETSTAVRIALKKPAFIGSSVDLNTAVMRENNSYLQTSNLIEEVRGFVGSLAGDSHTLGYEFTDNTIAKFGADASETIKQEKGRFTRSAVSYTYNYDDRDHPFISSEGKYFRSTVQVAGLGGDSKYVKHQMHSGVVLPLLPGLMFLKFNLSTGVLHNFGSGSRFSDRFFLGGPNDMRGFSLKGVGPHAGKDALGGDGFAHASGALETAVPLGLLAQLQMRFHLFAHAGAVMKASDMWVHARTARDAQKFAEPFRVSAGAGFVFPLPIGALEINYCKVVKSLDGDRTAPGVQVGLTLG
eukprot:TRINITY_DN957_c0_g1::TRINITY_DN957_c0_g1_i1::g.16003::m.16003 TRINITY_DN957_c0_g1::TRINITY_DN957_c0_g1_i1::g.16003  ORF type:complete len:452 (+),score=122.42,sp/Q10478/SAM50_SCHPO/25.06/5e-28,Bac_surface_Ag/PF01103.18/1.9e-43,DUF2422/PF10337.4/0.071 TRINITY_DN957_c0_g1_i1:48-1358(+)